MTNRIADLKEPGYYQDTGCPASPACLSCPLPRCVEEMKPREIARLLGINLKVADRISRGAATPWTQ